MGPYYDYLTTLIGAPARRESRPTPSRGATPGMPLSTPRAQARRFMASAKR